MRIAVVGDTLLDVDLNGDVDRMSPEAPVPVLSAMSMQRRPGGAGLTAVMLAHDGVDVALVTALSDDDRAHDLRRMLAHSTRRSPISICDAALHARTPVKTRMRSGDHLLMRLDEDCAQPETAPRSTRRMRDALGDADAILVADYGRGMAADPSLRKAISAAAGRIPVVWDPHPRGARPLAESAIVTPNESEARAAAGAGSTADRSDVAQALLTQWGVQAVVVTCGADGAVLQERGRLGHIVAATAVAGADTCGAGDRFAASVAAALAMGAEAPEAVETGVASAVAFLAAGGVSGLDRREPDPPAALTDGVALSREVRRQGGTVVATGGCFDLLHAGHARTLAAARALGDCHIVCLNSDATVRALKGPGRPIMNEEDRRDLLLALGCVDSVVIFEENEPSAVLRTIQPDVWVKGGDYDAETLSETPLVRSWGGRVVTVPYQPARSTTSLASALARVG